MKRMSQKVSRNQVTGKFVVSDKLQYSKPFRKMNRLERGSYLAEGANDFSKRFSVTIKALANE